MVEGGARVFHLPGPSGEATVDQSVPGTETTVLLSGANHQCRPPHIG